MRRRKSLSVVAADACGVRVGRLIPERLRFLSFFPFLSTVYLVRDATISHNTHGRSLTIDHPLLVAPLAFSPLFPDIGAP